VSVRDPDDLDFTSLVDEGAPVPPTRETPTPAEDAEALIGSQALGTEGFHLIAARRSGKPRATPANAVVLIVEDDPATGELAAAALRRAGFQAAVVAEPRDAARHMSRLGPPDLVLLDVEMPGMNGFDFLAKMRAHKRLKDTPVILFTAHSERRHIVRGLLAGADGYIAKPVSGTALASAVRTVLAA
jgi:two-component system, chemotaxis family, sensor kinase CheA